MHLLRIIEFYKSTFQIYYILIINLHTKYQLSVEKEGFLA